MTASAATEPRIALVSREVYPFGGGGLGNYVNWTARALAEVAEVTVLTTSRHQAAHRELLAAGDQRLDPRVRFVFVPDFDYHDHRTFYGYFHRWSANVLDALRASYPERGPDLIEFADYHGEGALTLQARRTAERWLRHTPVCVRLNSSSEMVLTLDGHLPADQAIRAMFELERYSLRYADRVIWPGGDVLGTYQRFYGPGALGPAVRIRHAVAAEGFEYRDAPTGPDRGGGPLRLLYPGRLERRKGVHNLVRALLSLEREDWRLTLVGGDTATGPLGVSVRGQLELMIAGDPRFTFVESVPRERVLELIDEHQVCVVPSLWECWPNVALEALQRGRPVLGTPTGGMVEMVAPGRSGLLAAGTSPGQLAEAIERVLDGELAELPSDGPRGVFEELTDPEPIREAYLELARTGGGTRPVKEARREPGGGVAAAIGQGGSAPLVSIVVTYFRLAEYVAEAIESLLAQTYDPLQIVVVNDGSFEARDRILERLAERHPIELVAQPNSGLAAARNLGISQALGDYVLSFDADNVAERRLVERLVEALEGDPEIAYATCWSAFVDEWGRPLKPEQNGYQPLGNWSRLIGEDNVAGDATALIRRPLFERGLRYDPELTSYEDWHFYRQLRRQGLVGQVVPERLYRYRVRPGSMLRTLGVSRLERQRGEMAAHLAEADTAWTQSSA
jgi:glycogen(starch) synthase